MAGAPASSRASLIPMFTGISRCARNDKQWVSSQTGYELFKVTLKALSSMALPLI